jgi:hypothetical protein
MSKVNIKNLRETYCPLCYRKLRLGYFDGEIPIGVFLTYKKQIYKRQIKKTDKATDLSFPNVNSKRPIYKVNAVSWKKQPDNSRALLNNAMFKYRYLHDYSKMTKYSFWECSNDDCFYYKCIDEIEYDFIRK